MDIEIANAFKKALDKQGFKFILNSKVTGGRGGASGCQAIVESVNNGHKETIDCDAILVSTGRKAYTQGLQLDKVGIIPDKYGKIETNEHFQTQVSNIYAIGDVIKGPMLAHKAEEEGIAAVEYIIG